MARRRSRSSQVERLQSGVPYDRTSAYYALPRLRYAFEEMQDEVRKQFAFPEDTVYPWYPSRPLRVYGTPSPYRHERSEFKRRVPTSLVSFRTLQADAKLMFCVRRKRRRQVLFALRRAGFPGSAPKKHYRRGGDSQWRC